MTKNTLKNGMRMRYARLALLTMVAIGSMAVPSGALGSPVYGISMTHAPAAGVNYPATPIAHGDRLYSYTMTFDNTGTSDVGPGAELRCAANTWAGTPSPTFSFEWLSNGVPATGPATPVVTAGVVSGSTYTVQGADAGAAVQCVVTATNTTNGETKSVFPVSSIAIAPVAKDASPRPSSPGSALSSRPRITPTAPANVPVDGSTLQTCTAPTGWLNTVSWTFRWLRNGVPIPGATDQTDATHGTYTPVAADAGAVLQCEVTGTSATGVIARGTSANRLTAGGLTLLTGGNVPTNTASAPPDESVLTPPTTVSVTLPEGVRADPRTAGKLQGGGWTCDQATLVCTRSDSPAIGVAYPPLTLFVIPDSDVPDELHASATIAGGGASAPATALDTVDLASGSTFGVHAFSTRVLDENGDDETRAGARPYSATASFEVNSFRDANGVPQAVEDPKTIALDLPAGFLGNPQSVPTCESSRVSLNTCPVESQVGVATTDVIGGGPYKSGVFNVAPRKGHPAEFAFVASSVGEVHLVAEVRTGGDYGLTIVTPYTTQARLLSASFTFWGVPADASHDAERCANFTLCLGAPSGAPPKPFLSNLTECRNEPPVTTLRTDSWQHPGTFTSFTAESPLMTGCDALAFSPTITVTPETTQADAPSGYDVHLEVPQTDSVSTLATPPLKDARVTLPLGVSLSPGTADGLEGCSDAQLNLHSAAAATCSLRSKIGQVHIATPLLAEAATDYLPEGTAGTHYQLTGNIYLRKPDEGAKRETLYSIFLDIEDAQTGIVVKLRGNVVPDATTGQLTATFQDNPRLPFTDFLLEFKGGDRAPLTNPMECGPAKTTSTLSSWGGPTAQPSSSFVVDWDGNGGACPAALPFTPTFSAGTVDPLAGAFSPFTMTIRRDDRQQIMSGIDVDMPSGLLGMVGSVPLCAEDQAAAGTCGDASLVGSTTVSAGAGGHPFSLPGKVFMAGPYKGQPFSLSIVVRAIAGPFDLGTVVVRAPIIVDAASAKLRVPADALPTILEGVPLRLRMINILLDRPQFIFNPSNCSPQQVGANLSSTLGTVAGVSAPYQASNCASLPFHPAFAAKSDGRLKFKNGAALNVNITQQPGEAAIKSVAVTLPKQLPSRLIPTINNACVQSVFEANPANCPTDSYIGTSTARTPVFPDPLTGPVYVIARAKEVPQIVVILHGQGIAKGIDLKLYGDIIIDSGGGRSKSTFHMVPDVPISSFALDLPAGQHSILDAPSSDVCQGPLTMGVNIVAQNGKRQDSNETVKVENCPKIAPPKILDTWLTKKGIAVRTLVPTLGRLVGSGKGLLPVARRSIKRGNVTVVLPYTAGTRRALQRRSLKVKVKVWFQPANAAKPTTKTVTVKVKRQKAATKRK